MVSMRDIADRCKVSVATVSKALNHHSDISEETRKRIQKAADEMGYYPNSAARALKTHRSYNIGVLLNDKANSMNIFQRCFKVSKSRQKAADTILHLLIRTARQ